MPAGHRRRPRRSSPAGQDRRDREGRRRRGEEDPGRRGHALRRRPVPPVHVQEVHRHPPRVRPREADRLLRRRPGQLRVPALRPRRVLLPRLRERQAGQVRALPEVEPGRAARRTSWCSSPGTPAGPTGEHGRRAEVPPRHSATRTCCSGSTGWKCCSAPGAAAASANAQRAKDELFGIQNSRKARIGGLGGLLDPALMGRKVAEEKRLQRVHRRQGKSASPAATPWLDDAQKAFDTVAKAEKVRAELIKEIHGAGERRRVQLGVVRHRPHAAPRRRGTAQADRRAAPRVRRRPPADRSSSSSSPTSRSTRTSRRSSSPTG